MPERSYKAPKGSKPIAISNQSQEFGFPPENTLSERYQEVLQEIKSKHKDYVQHPSKYQKPPMEVTILHPKSWQPMHSRMENFNFLERNFVNGKFI